MGFSWYVQLIAGERSICAEQNDFFLTTFPKNCLIAPSHGPVAQSVEQRIENPRVGGSIPPRATTVFSITPFSLPIAGFL